MGLGWQQLRGTRQWHPGEHQRSRSGERSAFRCTHRNRRSLPLESRYQAGWHALGMGLQRLQQSGDMYACPTAGPRTKRQWNVQRCRRREQRADEHKVVLKRDGTVWVWGNNGSGQFGNGGIDPSLTPVQVPGLSDVVKIAAGGTHTLAVKRDGTVWGWGLNGAGQLGDGTTTLYRRSPVQVLGAGGVGVLRGIVDIAAGQEFSLAVRNDGTVWAWGGNYFRQLGNSGASFGANPTPVQVEGRGWRGRVDRNRRRCRWQ